MIKIDEISKASDVSTKFISTVSASEKYNLLSLMDLIVEILPKEKKYAVLREANEDVKNEEMQEKAEKGIWDTVKEIAGSALEAVKDFAIDIILKSAGNKVGIMVRKLFSWFRE